MKAHFTNGWNGTLIQCPSQVEKVLVINDKKYHFYLRWRWSDPWSVECNDIDITDHFALEYTHDDIAVLLNWIDSHVDMIVDYVEGEIKC